MYNVYYVEIVYKLSTVAKIISGWQVKYMTYVFRNCEIGYTNCVRVNRNDDSLSQN